MTGWDQGFISLIGDLASRKAVPFQCKKPFPIANNAVRHELI